MLRRWVADAAVLAPVAPAVWREEVGRRLLAAWAEPHRTYHDTRHLSEVIAALEELEAAGELDADDARIARVTAWFHDAVYLPRAEPGSNERRSATLAREHLHRLDVDRAVIDRVEQLILLTADHQQPPSATAAEPAAAAFHDADLWILSAPVSRYEEYSAAVRQEYSHVPPVAFATGRAELLHRLTEVPAVFRTGHALAHWEGPARANVERELAALSSAAASAPAAATTAAHRTGSGPGRH